MITKMAPDLEMHDVEMIAEILKSVESQPGSGEIAVISLLTKTASLRADDAITFNEAAELAKMVRKKSSRSSIEILPENQTMYIRERSV